MTEVHAAGTGPSAVDQTSARSPLRGVVERLVISLGITVVTPAILLWVMLAIFNVATAVIVALAWMVGAMIWRWATKRSVSGLLLLTLGVMTARTAFTLVTGNSFVYFVQPVFADVAVGTLFLVSLCSERPIIARLAPDFFPMDATVTEQPQVRSLFRRLTLMWGLVILAKASITLWLLETLSTANFALIKGGAIITLTLTAAVVTLVWCLVVDRQHGVLRPRHHRSRTRPTRRNPPQDASLTSDPHPGAAYPG